MSDREARIVWITGASTGIGSALSELFALHGDIVVASARTESKLNKLHENIFASGRVCDSIICDVQNETSVSEAAKQILEKYRRVDVLINNAGVTYFKDFIDTEVNEFDHIINTNLRGVFLTTRAVLQAMLQNHQGLVINILSYIVKEVYTKSAAYTASKAGAEAMMNVLRAEVRRQGVNIVNIHPGAVATPMWHPKQREKYAHQMLTASQVAEIVYQISIQPPSLMVEEVVLRPKGGDLQP